MLRRRHQLWVFPDVLLGGALEQQRMDERLREVSSQLALHRVVFLGEQPGRAACRARALEPARCGHVVALLAVRERHQEAAQQECAFGLSEWSRVRTVAIRVAVLGEVVDDGLQGGDRARVTMRDRAPDGGQQKRGVDAIVAGRALPATGRVDAAG